jgi:hypothetical protein
MPTSYGQLKERYKAQIIYYVNTYRITYIATCIHSVKPAIKISHLRNDCLNFQVYRRLSEIELMLREEELSLFKVELSSPWGDDIAKE